MVKAVIARKPGGIEVLELIDDWKVPDVKADEVKVKAFSVGVNPVDTKVRKSTGRQAMPNWPIIFGGDIAGIVEEDSGKWKKETPVIALTDGFYPDGYSKAGTYTEYVNVKQDWLAKAPANVKLDTAAGGIPLVSLTAFQALETCNLKKGARVLVHAASGGVGNYAVQLAKVHFGAYVVGTCGPNNLEFVKQELGADEVVNYREEDFTEKYKDAKFDAVIDTIGGETEEKSYRVIKEGGTFAHILNTGTDQDRIAAGQKGAHPFNYTVTLVKPNGQQLQQVVDYIEEGKIKAITDECYPFTLEGVREAHTHQETSRARGKIVLQIVQLAGN